MSSSTESTAHERSASLTNEEQYLRYRSLSAPAVVSVIFAVISITAVFFVGLIFLPMLGLLIGLIALRSIRRRPDELTGGGLATSAIVMCLVFGLTSVTWATWVYVTELPDGYARVGFLELQPDKDEPKLPVSPQSLKMDGEKVFIKGYIYPDDRGAKLRQFVLVPDLGTCCFGGQPKLTDMVEVTLKEPLTTGYSMRQKKLGGVLHVDTRLKPVSGLNGVYYQLEADYLDGEFAE